MKKREETQLRAFDLVTQTEQRPRRIGWGQRLAVHHPVQPFVSVRMNKQISLIKHGSAVLISGAPAPFAHGGMIYSLVIISGLGFALDLFIHRFRRSLGAFASLGTRRN